ncbi:hypothetical protein THAOC_35108 [Thalassiosira oceanica]|uniref:Uncharacterized protein n=1 Tax=Thalassiosira oceanica TaxID=159749 RepID=K0RB27_THAOC|nr:hypothetical protein THAOC_35108 [Thalassiosira oceanica]|mmetsp:Transcript_10403/g.22572  ORF Transcript_10403/g.22572 Transcript_10403/m.22572 type:complete len:108 (-) Transcript_10403:122-445(-)|eukprot:EJK46231.1 hypothetical protein THAOC_35108 [Thalassiosira oceanica]
MSNPVTSWIKSCMETYKDREDWMVERVAVNSVNAQKLKDERHGPQKVHNYWRVENRTRPNFYPVAAISAQAGQAIGDSGSFGAMRAYSDGFKKRRDEILTDIARGEC